MSARKSTQREIGFPQHVGYKFEVNDNIHNSNNIKTKINLVKYTYKYATKIIFIKHYFLLIRVKLP